MGQVEGFLETWKHMLKQRKDQPCNRETDRSMSIINQCCEEACRIYLRRYQ